MTNRLMLRTRLKLGATRGGTTPFPNLLLDRLMPRLTDTQWRLLCVIVRQTYGWSNPDGTRKSSDWMSHFQLKRRTGRQSAAISRAIESLVLGRLIVVRDLYGRPLLSASIRRRSHQHLCFSLHPRLMSTSLIAPENARPRNSKSENNKRKVYKTKQQQLDLQHEERHSGQ